MLRLGLFFSILTCAAAAELHSTPSFHQSPASLRIVSPCVPLRPFTVAGEHGAILGRQNGKFEAWLWPVKILSNFQIRAELADYPVPIDVNMLAAEIEVTPAESIITYSHAAFSIRQHMFAVRGDRRPATGVAALFEVDSIRPLNITFSFTPEMLRMWPSPNFGRPNGEWVNKGQNGFYILHTDNPKFSAIIAMPHSRSGVMVPYQEHPQTYPLELKISYDPKRDYGIVFPLIMAMAHEQPAEEQVAALNSQIPQLYAKTQDYYAHFFDKRVLIDTPDRRVNEGLRWAELAIDQAQVSYGDETGLVAGYYESADSARPGYAWFFGRDTLWTSYAINSYGDFALTRRALDFLLHRQRADGKIMHEFSQSADSVDWKSTPYFYASADATPLLIMAMWDYVRTSGDIKYLQQNWDAIRKAYDFTRGHEGDDGIYNNTEGTGWVESWPPGMPHEEIYLASLDQQSAEAISHLASIMRDGELARDAQLKARQIASKIESEFYYTKDAFYAFSRNADGSLDPTASIYPAVAWWDGTFAPKQAAAMLKRWASSEFSTDWGTRDISIETPFYDPISYHQGSIWPLFTGWVSMAEYHAGKPLAGYAHLMQNLNLTWAQDLGSVTELLSGAFFQPLGRSSSHQLWSSAMVITPLLRGLFGLNWNAANHTIKVAPQLPADWDRVRLEHLALGNTQVDLEFERSGGNLEIQATTTKPESLCITAQNPAEGVCKEVPSTTHRLTIPLPAVELGIPATLPDEGMRTTQLKVLDERFGERQASFSLAGVGRSVYDLPLRLHRSHVTVNGEQINNGTLHVEFPDGTTYQEKTIIFNW